MTSCPDLGEVVVAPRYPSSVVRIVAAVQRRTLRNAVDLLDGANVPRCRRWEHCDPCDDRDHCDHGDR